MDKKKRAADKCEIDKPKNTRRTLLRLFRACRGQYAKLTAVIVSVVFYALLNVASPLYSARVVDILWQAIKQAVSGGTAFTIGCHTGGKQIVILFLLYLATWVFHTLQTFLMTDFAEKLNLRLRSDVSSKLERLPLSYFDAHQKGEMISLAVNDLDKMSETLQTGLLKLVASVGTIVGSVVMMFYFNIYLTLIFLAFTLISMLVTAFVAKKTLKLAARRQQDVSDMSAAVEENYSGRVIIKAFNCEAVSSEKIGEAAERLCLSSERADAVINAVNPTIRLVNRIGHVFIAVLAGKLLLEGNLSIGRFQAFFQYVNQSSEPITEAAYMINSMQSALASAERIFELLDESDISPDPKNAERIDRAKGIVSFNHVSFGYSADRLLMKDISFTALAGQKVAIVGSTGAGKTTLVNLLMRFYELSGGSILLDGADTSKLTRRNLRENFGMVLQDAWLFNGTIAENIAYGMPKATRAQIVDAAKAAKADFFIRTMPHGYDTILDDDAENISVGQRQLLTIARVMLCDPPLLILDEATSSVDTRTEMDISDAMHRLMNGRTSFVIAHRLSTIRDADMILVMKDGGIIEQGNHNQLLEKDGAYAELYFSQFA